LAHHNLTAVLSLHFVRALDNCTACTTCATCIACTACTACTALLLLNIADGNADCFQTPVHSSHVLIHTIQSAAKKPKHRLIRSA
jgi:hypothetical protein